MVLGPKEGSLCPMAPLDHSWEKPFPVPLESSCHRKEGEKRALCGLQVSEVKGVTRIFLNSVTKARRCVFGRQKLFREQPAEQIATIT